MYATFQWKQFSRVCVAGRNAEAEDYYKKAVRLRPSEASAHMNLGAILHFNGRWEEAEKSYLRALKLRPNDPVTEGNLQKLRNLMRAARGCSNAVIAVGWRWRDNRRH